MTKGDFYPDDVERTQRLRTDGRRRGRMRRKSTYALLLLGLLLAAVIGAPSLVCQSPIGRNLVRSTLATYGFDGGVESLRIGWMSPLRVDGLELTGSAAGSHIRVERVETDLTLLQCIRGLSDLGEVSVRGVVVEASVSDGRSSIEDDLAILLAGDGTESGNDDSTSNSSSLTGRVTAQDVAIRVTDKITGKQWVADQSQATVDLSPEKADATFSTVLTDPAGGSGEMEGRIQYSLTPNATNPGEAYQLNLVTQRIPLSLVSLAKRWLGESGAAIPAQVAGDTSGSMTVVGAAGNAISISVSPLEFRNFVASDPSLGERIWRNGLTSISGSATIEGDRIIGRDLQLTTDFGSASFNGAFNTSISVAGVTNPAAWLEALDGTAGASVDLVAFERALPGLIPFRDQAEISAGGISAEVTSAIEGGAVRRSHWNLKTAAIRGRAAGRAVLIEPATLIASIRVADGELAADTIRLESTFANATVDGDLSRGRVKGDIQFSRLASMIQPLLEMPELSLAGQATGEVSWAAEEGDLWRLRGKTDATDLIISLPGGTNFQQAALGGEVDATGRWANGALRELSALTFHVNTTGVELDANLTTPVANPSTSTAFPLQIVSRGRLEELATILGPWMPTSVQSLQGAYTANATATVAMASGEVTVAKLQVEEPRVEYGEQRYSQAQLAVDFDGLYAWPAGTLEAKTMTIVGEAFSAAVQGTMTSSTMNLEVAWRADLGRLQGAMRPTAAMLTSGSRTAGDRLPSDRLPSDRLTNDRSSRDATPVGFRDTPATGSYLVTGDCSGRLKARMEAGSSIIAIDSNTTGNKITLIDPTKALAPGAQQPFGSRPALNNSAQTVWAERLVNFDAIVRYDMNDGAIDAERLQLACDWVATSLTGKALWNDAIGDVALRGSARIKMPEVATQLSTLLGTQVRLEGLHETPIELVAARKGTGSVALAVKANIGWESGEVAGIVFGPTAIPVSVTETTVSIQPATIPVDKGQLLLAGDLHYSPGPMWMSVKPGVVAENIRLTPELTSRWLQYLAPMAANATRIDGTFGVELAEGIVNLDDPNASKVRGNLRINGVNLDSGPVANQIISSVKQIRQLARGAAVEETPEKDKRLVTFPSQAVDFEFANGVITHQRMFMEIDRAKIITSGQVHVDGRLNMVAQLPLDASWLGSDLKSLAGKSVTLPIDGTLSRPSLDSAAIRNLVGELGVKALQSTAESYLEKQLGRGFEKLLGR